MDYDDFADLYAGQYAHYREDLHHYAALAGRAGGPVLEIGAGTGRVSAHLSRRGVAVTGIEPSARMRERAQALAQAEGLDFRVLPGTAQDFALPGRFALAIAPFNALMHLYTPGEQLAALQNIRRHLTPGGRFAFDLYVPNFGASGVLRHEGETLHHAGGRTDIFLVQRINPLKQLAETEYFVDTTANDGSLRREHFTLTQRYYTAPEVHWLLRCAGFGAPRVSGSFQGGPLREGSEVMVFEADAGG